MTSTHGKTPAEVAEGLIAAVQRFRDAAAAKEAEGGDATAAPRDHEDLETS